MGHFFFLSLEASCVYCFCVLNLFILNISSGFFKNKIGVATCHKRGNLTAGLVQMVFNAEREKVIELFLIGEQVSFFLIE